MTELDFTKFDEAIRGLELQLKEVDGLLPEFKENVESIMMEIMEAEDVG